ncbi:winged helix-turn-helix transcriptional regulator [Halanaerobium hydrogeniformans]|uniref:Regulatory protein MarR n=1 Tax=Halanaerobium hydrogeniformans TaxID=656519 RepID=E4RNK0_HALHG|nr:winged helix-turn-helix transcriptional regulator [Halanaerobium hydrogeniformans]ADQ13535.1 regulatory protein MarR [Halanaerobium hydrogeniformans]
MEEKITDILIILDREDSPSQRKIADQTGFSLGLVNALIKKCAKKGLVKIKKLNSRNMKYILTPKGIKEKTKKTIDYVKKSYQAINQLQASIEELANKHSKEGKNIYILEERKDEIRNIVQNILVELEVDYTVVDGVENIEETIFDIKENVLYHWNPGLETNFKEAEVVNIFRY